MAALQQQQQQLRESRYQQEVYCTIHKRKRRLFECIEVGDGQYRCRPDKECRDTTMLDQVTCQVHGKKRLRTQCVEVRPGVFECSSRHPCRIIGNVAEGAAGERYNPLTMTAGSAPSYSGAPAAPGPATADSMIRQRAPLGGFDAFYDPTQQEVWCARHGKRLLRSSCRLLESGVLICIDPSVCIAGGLEPSRNVVLKGCRELLCAAHNHIRRSNFLELKEVDQCYVCSAAHPCSTDESETVHGGTLEEVTGATDRSGY